MASFQGPTNKQTNGLMIIVATTSLPTVDRLNADRWNAARSCQKKSFLSNINADIV